MWIAEGDFCASASGATLGAESCLSVQVSKTHRCGRRAAVYKTLKYNGFTRIAEAFMRRISVCLLLASFALGGAYLDAGSRTGTVAGIVVERTGHPAAGAEVMIERSDGSAPVATRTNSSGRFLFKYVLSGLYDIRASRGSASTVWKHNVMVRRGKETQIELRLEPIEPKTSK